MKRLQVAFCLITLISGCQGISEAPTLAPSSPLLRDHTTVEDLLIGECKDDREGRSIIFRKDGSVRYHSGSSYFKVYRDKQRNFIVGIEALLCGDAILRVRQKGAQVLLIETINNVAVIYRKLT